MTTPDERRRHAEARRDELLAAVRADRENARYLARADPRMPPPTHPYAGENPERQSVGDPGHCEPCARIGHVRAHPDVGCGDVGCGRAHSSGDPADAAPPASPDPDPGLIRARWVCGVVRSGYHNGAWCTPAEPHSSDWGCCWRYEISLTVTPENEAWLRAHGFNPQPAT